jgi:hypothetical protein
LNFEQEQSRRRLTRSRIDNDKIEPPRFERCLDSLFCGFAEIDQATNGGVVSEHPQMPDLRIDVVAN